MTASETPVKEKIPGVLKLLNNTFSLYFKHFGIYFGYAAWLFIPLVVTIMAFSSFSEETVELIEIIFNVIVYGVLAIWLTVIFILLTPVLYFGFSVKTRQLSAQAWTLMIPYLLISILVSFINLGGFILLIIPGLIFMVWFAFAPIITVLEKAHVTAALKRSRELSKGRFLAVFWRLIAGAIAIMSLIFTVYILLSLITASLSGMDLITYLSAPPTILDATLLRVAEVFFLPVIVIYQILLYLELKKNNVSAKVTSS